MIFFDNTDFKVLFFFLFFFWRGGEWGQGKLKVGVGAEGVSFFPQKTGGGKGFKSAVDVEILYYRSKPSIEKLMYYFLRVIGLYNYIHINKLRRSIYSPCFQLTPRSTEIFSQASVIHKTKKKPCHDHTNV